MTISVVDIWRKERMDGWMIVSFGTGIGLA